MSAQKLNHVFFTLVAIIFGSAHTTSYSSNSNGSPPWNYGGGGNACYWSYVSDGLSAVQNITFNQSSTGYLYGIVVNGIKSGKSTDGYNLNPVPNYNTTGTTFNKTVTIASTQNVTFI